MSKLDIERIEKDMLKYISLDGKPYLLSKLYDSNLLPEQLKYRSPENYRSTCFKL